jgi:hypothetical protein
MRRDWNNDPIEVLKLQSFLNVFEGENLSYSGTFDQSTFDAVSRFQNKYFEDILAPWGHTAPTGFVYILTKKKVNEIFCNTVFPLTAEQQNEISAFKAYLESISNGSAGSGAEMPDFGETVGAAPSGSLRNGGLGANALSGELGDILNDVEGDTATGGGDGSVDRGDILRNAAVSLFALPSDAVEMIECALVFLIILAAAYALSSLLAGRPTLEGGGASRVRVRKLVYIIALFIIAAIIASVVRYLCVILPLGVAAIVALLMLIFGGGAPAEAKVEEVPVSGGNPRAPMITTYEKSLDELAGVNKEDDKNKDSSKTQNKGFKGILDEN